MIAKLFGEFNNVFLSVVISKSSGDLKTLLISTRSKLLSVVTELSAVFPVY
jgi:hypothetical protein